MSDADFYADPVNLALLRATAAGPLTVIQGANPNGWESVQAACLPACRGCDRTHRADAFMAFNTCIAQRAYENRHGRAPMSGLQRRYEPTPEFMLR